MRKALLALLLCLSLLMQMGAVAFAADSSLPEEGMLSTQETQEPDSSQSEAEASSSAQAEENDAEEQSAEPEAQSGDASKGESAEAEEAPEAEQNDSGEQDEAPAEKEAGEDTHSGGEGEDIGSPEFWEEFHEEYAEDGDYLKRYELYQEQGVKRAFEDDDDVPGTIEAMSEEELEAMSADGGKTKSPFTGKTYTHAASKKGKKVVLGIDVSKWQDDINWSKVKAAGVKFVFLRCGYTRVHSWGMKKDELFDTYIKQAHEAGIPIGIYYFSQATKVSEAQAEAKKTLALIQKYKSWITLPVVMDIETGTLGGKAYRINKVSRSQGTKNVQAYCKIIKDAGYQAYYYGNPNDLADMCDVAQLGSYGCWLARYATSTTYSGSYDFWQYTSSGKVSGISGGVDCNFWYTGSSSNNNTAASSGKPGQVTGLSCTGKGDNWLALKWNALNNAQNYTVEGMVSGGSYTTLTTSVGNTCKVTGLTSGTRYSIRVKAGNVKGTGQVSAVITVSTTGQAQNRTDLPAPVLESVENTFGGVRVGWLETEGAQMFRVLRKEEGGSWDSVGETTELSFLDTSAKNGTLYTYTVRCINASDRSDAGSIDETGKSITYYAAPELKSAKLSGSNVTFSWSGSDGNEQFRVYRKEGSGSWKKQADVTGTSYTDENVTKGKVYSYTVRCLKDGKLVSGYDAQGKQLCVLSAPTVSSVKNKKKKSLTVKWSKVNEAKGYQVRFVCSGVKTVNKSVSGTKKTSVTVKNLKKKKTYKVSVRAWRKVGGKTWYSSWSKAKSAKVSK